MLRKKALGFEKSDVSRECWFGTDTVRGRRGLGGRALRVELEVCWCGPGADKNYSNPLVDT